MVSFYFSKLSTVVSSPHLFFMHSMCPNYCAFLYLLGLFVERRTFSSHIKLKLLQEWRDQNLLSVHFFFFDEYLWNAAKLFCKRLTGYLLCIPYYPPRKLKVRFCRLENLPYESLFFPTGSGTSQVVLSEFRSQVAIPGFILGLLLWQHIFFIFVSLPWLMLFWYPLQEIKKYTHGKILKRFFLYLSCYKDSSSRNHSLK